MKIDDTVKIVEWMTDNEDRTVTGKVVGFHEFNSEVEISQGDKHTWVVLSDIVSLETITQEVKKTKGLPSKIGVPS